jgi:hypothetical protein
MLLVDANLTEGNLLTKFEHSNFYVICKTKHCEPQRSKHSEKLGLTPTWSQEVVRLEYKEPFNIVTIEVRERDKPDGKPVCIGSSEISLFLENENTIVSIPLTRDDNKVGMVRFETSS